MTFARLECGFDGDACCPFDIYSNQFFKDGICNGGRFNTAGCMYDSGDCGCVVAFPTYLEWYIWPWWITRWI